MEQMTARVLVMALSAIFALTELPSTAAEESADICKEEVKSTGYRGSYFKNGEIHVNEYGTPEGKPLTSGHQDFKPSWSKTGDMLVFFRRLKNDPVVTNWKTQIHIINVDGTGLHPLTDGTHTDFNQTWTRDGTNTPIWNRRHPERVSFQVMASKVGNKPGQEIALTDKSYHTWAYTCLIDGRILVQCAHPNQGWGYYLMTPNPGGEPKFERIACELATKGILDRVSISPSETKVCFEYQTGYQYKDAGRTLYIADFDAKKPSITNAKAFANEEGANRWFAYPRWTKDEKAIVYHASPSIYMYSLEDGSTVKVSTQDGADYRYPHCEATPK
jgi:Tol biopolymer transport system component